MAYVDSRCGLIDAWSFEFEEATIPAYSTAGTRYHRRVRVGMPRLPSNVTDCVFYLYPTVEDAKRGENVGGTGFFFSVEPGDIPGHYYYAVTNWHNIFKGKGAPVIRINSKDGEPEIFELDHLDWIYKPKWHDLAVADISLDLERLNIAFVSSSFMVSSDQLEDQGVGLGADVYMVGRFMDHDGGEVNVPAVRFGNIAVLPQPVTQPTGAKGLPSYVLDMHSRSGFSGSPVFALHDQVKMGSGTLTSVGSQFITFLGIHWGQFPERWEIDSDYRPKIRQKEHAVDPSSGEVNAHFVKGFSGMTLALPAEALMELLEEPKLKEPRERAIAEARRAHQGDPVAESAEPPTTGDNPDHREDFNRLLGAAVSGPKRGSGK